MRRIIDIPNPIEGAIEQRETCNINTKAEIDKSYINADTKPAQ
jgi:hypothetical protein